LHFPACPYAARSLPNVSSTGRKLDLEGDRIREGFKMFSLL